MTAWPTITVRAAFGDNAFASTTSWTDISDDVRSISIRRGRTYEINRIEAGVATVTLLNIDGDYWPNNTTGAYYPNVKPVTRINIQAAYPTATTTYDLFTGYIESWQPDWLSYPIKAPVMVLSCADLQKNISRFLINDATGYNSELTGARIGNVLDDMSWPSTDRSIATGQSNLISTGPLANVNAMDHVYSVLDAELGIFFVSASGAATFHDRLTRNVSPYATSDAIFTDTTTSYVQPKISYDDMYIYNDCRGTKYGSTEEIYWTNTTSIDAYGHRALNADSLLNSASTDIQDRLYYQLARYKDPLLRVDSILIKPSANPDTLYPYALGFDISRRITFALGQASINQDYYIEGISHDWSAEEPENWVTSWQVSNATDAAYPVRTTATTSVTGDGDYSQLDIFPTTGALTHYDKVLTAGDGKGVWNVSSPVPPLQDLYTVNSLATSAGLILSVTVKAIFNNSYGSNLSYYLLFKYAGTLSTTGYVSTSPGTSTTSYTWTFPQGLSVAEWDSSQIGLKMIYTGDYSCDKLWAEVTYYSV